MKMVLILPPAVALVAAMIAAPAAAQQGRFSPGPAIERFGSVAPVQNDWPIPPGTRFSHAFDIAEGAAAGEINRGIDSAARFVNMLAQAGVPPAQVLPALVIHGQAVRDVTRAGAGPNAELVRALIERGALFYVCGQSAAAQGIGNDQLLPGVKMALSAMTAHARLQQQGFTLNPF